MVQTILLEVRKTIVIGAENFNQCDLILFGKLVAAKELEEECGITIDASELIDLTAFGYGANVKGIYMSPGGCDEFIRLFACVKTVTKEKLEQLEGKLTGNLEEGETICLKIVPFDDLWKVCHEAKALSSLFLYEKYLVASQSQ